MIRKQFLLLFPVILFGVAILLVSGFYLLQDWSLLNQAFRNFDHATKSTDLTSITVAYDYQNIYRINCFAEGVGVLVGMVIIAVGVVGICLLMRPRAARD